MSELTDEPRKRPKPVDFDQLYPGRFIKAGELLGKKVTLTITDYNLEDLIGDDGAKKPKATLTFRETEKQMVMCKTNGICLKSMFGKTLSVWVGKRITIFPDTWNGEPCIRIWGSPDIPEDMEVDIQLPRRRPFKKTMHRMGSAAKGSNGNGQGAPTNEKAIADLRSATSLDGLAAIRKSIWGLYAAAGAELPIEVEAVANEKREALEQRV